MRKLVSLLVLSGTLVLSAQAGEKLAHYGVGNAWLHIDYPATYTMDSKSHQGDGKWWAKFSAADGSLAFDVSSFGHVSGGVAEEGFKTPEDYVLRREIRGEPLRTRHDGYDRFIRVDTGSVMVVFLEQNAKWGRCFQSLRFTFAEGSYEKHRDVIMKIVDSAKPWGGREEKEVSGGEAAK